jgi:hypothetical protein
MGLPLVALVGFSTSAVASTEATGASTVSPTLAVSATVQKAIRLTLSQGPSGTACAVTTASDYSMTFGTVDALGINAPNCGAKFAPTNPGTDPSAYYTDYRLTPVFTNQAQNTATINAYVSSNFPTLSGILAVVQANAAPGNIAALSAMSTNPGSQTTIGSGLGSGTAITRYLGVTVMPNNGANTSGTDTATITYTMTAP